MQLPSVTLQSANAGQQRHPSKVLLQHGGMEHLVLLRNVGLTQLYLHQSTVPA